MLRKIFGSKRDEVYCDVHAVRRLFTAVAMQRNNRAAEFSLRSVPVMTSLQQ
jgi:hypothetical protein